MSIDYEILERAKLLLNSDNNTTASLCEQNEMIAHKVAAYIEKMNSSIPPELIPADVVDYLCEHNTDSECESYIGKILVQDYGVNPLKLYATIDKEKFWNIHHIFDDSFLDISDISNECVINSVDNIYRITSGDMMQGIIGSSLALCYKNRPSQLEELFITFQAKPTRSMMWFLCYSANHLASFDIELTNRYLISFIKSKQAILMYAGVRISKNLLKNYWNVINQNVLVIINELNNTNNNPEFKEFIAVAVTFIYQVDCEFPEFYSNDSLFDIIFRLIKSNSDLIKYFLAQEVFRKIYSEPLKYSSKDEKYISLLSGTKIDNNKGLIDQIDMLINWEVKHNKMENAWKNIEIFNSMNPKIKLRDSLDSVFHLILNKIEEFLPNIYQNIELASNRNSVGLQLIESFAFERTEHIRSVNWLVGIETVDILCIARKIFVTCVHPEFVTYWGAVVLQEKIATAHSDYFNLYKEWVCENYPMTAQKVIKQKISDEGFDSRELETLQTFCSQIISERTRISQIRDFSPSQSRLLAYQTEQMKQNAELSKLGESKSIFFNLVSRATLKYGVRSAFVQKQGDIRTLRESEYAHFEFSIEMPRLFISDPLFLYICTKEAFPEVDKS